MPEQHAIFRVRPPHLAAGSDKQKALTVAYTVASSAELDLGLGASGLPGEFVEFVSTTDCHVAFGPTGMGAATANDFFLPAKTLVRRWCLPVEEGFVRAIRDTADGSLFLYTPGG